MEDGPTLVNLLAYVDLNPIRAGIVKRPEEYTWCSLGYFTRLNSPSVYGFAVFNWASVQTKNKDNLLCVDFGMQEWNECESLEIVRKYRAFVYETGAAEESEEKGVRSEELKKRGIDPKIVKKERKKKYKVSRVDRFRYRCRYFPPSETTPKEFLHSRVSPGKPTPGSSDPRLLWRRPQ